MVWVYRTPCTYMRVVEDLYTLEFIFPLNPCNCCTALRQKPLLVNSLHPRSGSRKCPVYVLRHNGAFDHIETSHRCCSFMILRVMTLFFLYTCKEPQTSNSSKFENLYFVMRLMVQNLHCKSIYLYSSFRRGSRFQPAEVLLCEKNTTTGKNIFPFPPVSFSQKKRLQHDADCYLSVPLVVFQRR